MVSMERGVGILLETKIHVEIMFRWELTIRLKRIEGNLLKIVFSEIPLQKMKCLLEDKGYNEFCSSFAKRAVLTPEEMKYLFENVRAW